MNIAFFVGQDRPNFADEHLLYFGGKEEQITSAEKINIHAVRRNYSNSEYV